MENEKFTSLTQKKGKQVYIPNILLEAAKVQDGDYIEVTIRKIIQIIMFHKWNTNS
jgi:antitoxin component of MazEF toxin-antitoxin module